MTSLAERRTYLLGRYVLKIKAMHTHPSHAALFDQRFVRLFDNKPLATLPTGLRCRHLFRILNFDVPELLSLIQNPNPPWLIPKPDILFDLCKYDKNTTSDVVFQTNFKALCHDHQTFRLIFTDGSKTITSVGCAYICGVRRAGFRLHDMCSVFTAELNAIREALKYILQCRGGSYMVCSDSKSALQAIHVLYSPHHLVVNIQCYLAKLHLRGYTVKFCWTPGHVGIEGNEQADLAAKMAADLDDTDFDLVPVPDVNNAFKNHMVKLGQACWDALHNNKLRRVMPSLSVKVRPPTTQLSRREEVVLTRVRIGHTYLTHAYLFDQNKIAPKCDTCDVVLTVHHLLAECSLYDGLRLQLSLSQSYEELLSYDNCGKHLTILKQANLINRL